MTSKEPNESTFLSNMLKKTITYDGKNMSVKEALYTGMIKEALNGNIKIAKYLLKLEFEERKQQEHSVGQELAKLKSAIRKINKQNKYSPYPKLDPEEPEVSTEPIKIGINFIAPKQRNSVKQDSQSNVPANINESNANTLNQVLSLASKDEAPKEPPELTQIKQEITAVSNQIKQKTEQLEGYYTGERLGTARYAKPECAFKIAPLNIEIQNLDKKLITLLEKQRELMKSEEGKSLVNNT